jgi:hypothetical protein
MEIDQPVASGSGDNDDGLREKVATAERTLLEAHDDKSLSRRTKKCALRVLCRDRGLSETGDKIHLASRLINWVSSVPSTMYEQGVTHT